MRQTKAIALVEGEGPISLTHIFAAERRAEWQAELDALTAKLAQKGTTHNLRILDILITEVS